MSLIMLGKVSAEAKSHFSIRHAMKRVASTSDVTIIFDALCKDDQMELEESQPSEEKIYFLVNSSMYEPEATTLWIDALDHARNVLRRTVGDSFVYSAATIGSLPWPEDYIAKMRGTRLAQFLYGIAAMDYYQDISIALIDGGIETEFRGTADECIEEILRMVVLPWDCGPNGLYMWSRL